jgi:8-oxo-dGTP pyrophosphatase MutT (NUDIX family)
VTRQYHIWSIREHRVKEAEETPRREVLEETGLRVSGQQLRMR